MTTKTFGSEPFNMNWNILIQQNDEPLCTLYIYLGQLNSYMKKVKGTEVNSNRYGAYLFLNNYLLALHAYIKAIETKNALLQTVLSRQLTEIHFYAQEITANYKSGEGFDKVLARLRFYAGYILWQEMKEFEIGMKPENAELLNHQDNIDFPKNSDVPSLLFHEQKDLISSLKLEYVISYLNNKEREGVHINSFFTAVNDYFTYTSGLIEMRNGVFASLAYKNSSKIIHGIHNSLLVNDNDVIGGFMKIKMGNQNEQEKMINILSEIQIMTFGFFSMCWKDIDFIGGN